ncbi:hypothetical protein SDC9_28783 [bioreactor metagenome]|uniref:Uncharacterized protein n=1 Tax=bioreactor metagenome TaxID=1076179 RepID=A0A644UVD8_9ZZZZ
MRPLTGLRRLPDPVPPVGRTIEGDRRIGLEERRERRVRGERRMMHDDGVVHRLRTVGEAARSGLPDVGAAHRAVEEMHGKRVREQRHPRRVGGRQGARGTGGKQHGGKEGEKRAAHGVTPVAARREG